MDIRQFKTLLEPVVQTAAGRALDTDLERALNAAIAPGSALFRDVERACHEAIAAGWMCTQGEGRRRFGRVIEPGEETAGLSVDVVDLTDIVGPHHRHPRGEICMIMPVDAGAEFDGRGAGWCVYGAGSAHRPTVSGGRALVLYMLPGGEIEFTGQ